MRAARCRTILPLAPTLSLALALLAAAASAQAPGEVLWSIPLDSQVSTAAPAVAPDGTIYIHSGDLVAISPDGTVLWSQPIGDAKSVDIGDDGTVYAGAGMTIFAFDPAGSELWRFTEPPGGQGLMAGPTQGPDGNIYAVTDGGGLGALALSPEGDLLWNVPGFVNTGGTGNTPAPVTGERLYFAEDFAPSCGPLAEGLAGVSLDGDLLWCVSISGVARPVASPTGNAHLHDFGALYTYGPDGDVVWSFAFPFPSGTLIGPSVGPDGTVYIFHNFIDLWSFTADGDERWTNTDLPAGNFPVVPAIAPDNASVVVGTVFSFGVNGSIYAVDASDGALLWSLPISGPSAGAAGPAAFSPGGSVAYVPLTSIGGGNQLLAIQVREGGETPMLAAGGVCPGTVDFSLSGFTPNGRAQVYVGRDQGSTTLTTGPCAGTVLDLANARRMVNAILDAGGEATVSRDATGSLCGRPAQALDLTTCALSNLATMP